VGSVTTRHLAAGDAPRRSLSLASRTLPTRQEELVDSPAIGRAHGNPADGLQTLPMNLPPDAPPPDNAPIVPPEQFDRVLELVTAIARTIPATPEPKYLTVQEAAAYCRVAVQTIYNNRRYITRMPGVRKLLFTWEALDAWLARRPSARRKRT